MKIITQTHLVTTTRWFNAIDIDGNKIVAKTDPEIGEIQTLVIAIIKDVVTRNAFVMQLNEAVHVGKETFSVPAWLTSWTPVEDDEAVAAE